MIVFDLTCSVGHRFEGWFGSSEDFRGQKERGLVTCPDCGSAEVVKAPMAPAVPKKGNQHSAPARKETQDQTTPMTSGQVPPDLAAALHKLAMAQAKALENSTWVGTNFAEQSRAMHYGERGAAPIHGETSLEEAAELLEEGIEVAPLPFPVSPPDELN